MPGYTVRHQCDPPALDGYTPEGVPVYINTTTGCEPSALQLSLYSQMCSRTESDTDKESE